MKTQLTARIMAVLLSIGAPVITPAGDWFATRPGEGYNHPALLHFDAGGWCMGLTDAMQFGEGLQGVAIGPDGNVYVADNTLGDGDVMRFHRETGAFMGYFVPWAAIQPGSNVLTVPFGITFGPDGNLYVASVRFDPTHGFGPGRIFRYDGLTGEPVGDGVFVPDGSGGLQWPYDLEFGPDGHLYVSDRLAGVLKFDGASGDFLGVVAQVGQPGLRQPSGITFGADGLLYVADYTGNSVLRYSLVGGFLGVFVAPGSGGLSSPRDIDFGSDGRLYVAADGNNTVLVFRGTEGSPLGEFTVGAGQYFNPSGPAFLCEVKPYQVATLKINSFSRAGVLSWTGTYTGGVYTVQMKEALPEPWRTAPYHEFCNIPATGSSGSLDLPLAHEYDGSNAPDTVVAARTAFFRLVWSPEPIDPRAAPTTNRVFVVNRSLTTVSNLVLSMVGSTNQALVSVLPPNVASPPLLFHLPGRPSIPPISWSDYAGSYELNGQSRSLFVVLPPTDLRIILSDTRHFLW